MKFTIFDVHDIECIDGLKRSVDQCVCNIMNTVRPELESAGFAWDTKYEVSECIICSVDSDKVYVAYLSCEGISLSHAGFRFGKAGWDYTGTLERHVNYYFDTVLERMILKPQYGGAKYA